MHTYRNAEDGGWQVGYQHALSFEPRGPTFDIECKAAAFACFLNGGRYNPYEIEELFFAKPVPADDDSTYPRPQGMDYEPEQTKKRQEVGTS